jgi:hypothetical protein
VIFDDVSGREKPMLSNAYGSGTCQYAYVPLASLEGFVSGKGDAGSFGI